MPAPLPQNLELNDEARRLLERLMLSGRFETPEEAVEAGLCFLLEEEARRAATAVEIRRKIAEGIAEEERGDLLDGAEVLQEWRRLDEEDSRRSRRSA